VWQQHYNNSSLIFQNNIFNYLFLASDTCAGNPLGNAAGTTKCFQQISVGKKAA